ncbi:hypothetical protein LX32DRAFT_728818 [Colletotrichum zoysiae]|uniref:Biotrophy-associated secreted protein 2 n=1 Tax=Colletotrichum zoysiae TaxID=1216348 RepID=A0AAD9M180_9PEZI|nr:hypothetical protein LX32DRAFT_728818 [Colletotrichum zoysiae]
MKTHVALVLSALLAAVAAAPPAAPTPDPSNPDEGCWKLGHPCLFGDNCCSGKCDVLPGQTAGNPQCVTEYSGPPGVGYV